VSIASRLCLEYRYAKIKVSCYIQTWLNPLKAPTTSGVGIDEVADVLGKLMARLGYTEFCVQGGDWGSLIARAVAVRHPQACLSLHVNMAVPCIPDSTA
jgi:pimeloyl-ACP methyl ester carboxylesterase